MRARPLLLALGLLLAGCVEADTVPAPSTPALPPHATPADAPTPAESAPPAADAPVEEAPRVVPLAYEGSTPRWACVPDGPASCRGVGLGAPGRNAVYALPVAGVTAVDATLSWSAATPATGKMRVSLIVLTPCGDGCHEWARLVTAEGGSPLSVERGGIVLEPAHSLALVVEAATPSGGPVPMSLSLDQSFAVRGNLTVG